MFRYMGDMLSMDGVLVMLMQLWRPEYVRDGISLDNLCLCLPIRTSHFFWEENYTEVVCIVVH